MKCLAVLVIALLPGFGLQAQDLAESTGSNQPSSTVTLGATDSVLAADSVRLNSRTESIHGVDVTVPVAESPEALPRSIVFRTDGESESPFASDSTQLDSLPPLAKPKLLPDNISFMERWLWGESGIVRSMGIASPLTPEVRKHELAVRRTMLTMHQIGGFVTLASMITADYFGQKYLDHAQRGDLGTHQAFVVTTIASYSATAMLSVLSPPPLIRREGEVSTTTIHKTLAWVHFAGMIVTPLLASAINRRGSSYYQQARVHQISAYITTAVFAASMIVVTF